MFACIYSGKLSDVSLRDFAYSFSPRVEETAGDTVVIDVRGCELLFGSAYELANEIVNRAAKPRAVGGLGGKINVAIAANPDAAIYAARYFKGVTFISPGEELTCLGELPIALLCPISIAQPQKTKGETPHKSTSSPGFWTLDEKSWEDTLETFRLWGIRTFADFAALPRAALSERLGQDGLRLQLLASGKSERQLELVQPAPDFGQSIELDYAIAELEPLSFTFARLLNQLCASLNSYGLATNELCIEMKLETGISHERKLSLPYPLRDHKVFLKLLLLDVEMHPPPAAVTSISIACEPVKPRVLQHGLFIPLTPEPEKLELTLARIMKLVGHENVGSPELVDTHRPAAFHIHRFALKNTFERKNKKTKIPQSAIPNPQCSLAFRIFRPPLRATVEAPQGCPTWISAWAGNQSVYGKIVRAAGPWRTTGNWWRANVWARDEWDVAVETLTANRKTGPPLPVLYRTFRELDGGGWFVEGMYD